eukprot:TRINITY_DN11960_c0_g1_i1.p1 TRINITY_DN11960_c0_g1~~TRINITY_DN11960_c0_g1_i1.p1  ORF type:complete len:112 (-),score=7.01 TRINITY_DN11960_c0_g1_i1:130-465(-)
MSIRCDKSTEFTITSFTKPSERDFRLGFIYQLGISSNVLCGSSNLSGGSWFLIFVFAIVLPIYLIGGISWNYFHKKSGADLFPHYSFWSNLPDYFVRGFVFTKNKISQLLC